MGSSRSGDNTPRARRALAAMRALGFSKKPTLTVLKRLLRVYGNNWALIEDESYRVLAEAMLDSQQASGGGGSEPEPVQEHEGINDDMAGGDPSGSLGPPSPPPPTTAREMVVSPRSQARASMMALGKRRHRETIDADLQLEDAVLLREPKPVPVDMEEVQPGLIGRRSRNASSSSELFRDLPPQQPDQNPEQIPGEHQKVFCETCPLERSRNKASPKPCRSHLVRKFIKECWSKCGCNMQCGNRVVQRGITCNLQVFFTGKGTGWGLRTLDKLPKGAFVCEYAGEILTNTELHERVVENMQNDRYVHPILLDAGWCSRKVLKEEEALCLDGTFYGNVGRFINHRCCDANLVVVPVEVETPDHHYYHLAFFTSTKVEAFEELTWDYGIDFDAEKQKPVKPFECLCGSRYCRGRKHHPRKKSATAAGAD